MRTQTLGLAAQLMETAFENTNPFFKVIVDSRLLGPGDLFFALPGEKTDGHNFLHEISLKKAAGAVVNINYQGPNHNLPLIRVPNVLKALQNYAKNLLIGRQTQIVGVTGSVGKTTTKEFITTMLKHRFRIGCTPGNNNSQIGMPLAVINETTGDEQILVIEMGMTNSGEIAQLTQIAPPTVAVITQVALVHAAFFDSLRDIAKAKAEIFQHPHTKVGIYNLDIADADLLHNTGTCEKVTYSAQNPNANYLLKNFQIPDNLALHNQMNALAAIAVGRYFGMSSEQIQQGVSTLQLPERRGQLIEKNGVTFVNDSYNASEISLKAALTSLPKPRFGGKTIAIIGEMLELGKFSEKCHQEVAKTALDTVDHLLCMGKDCAPMQELWTKSGKPVYWLDERSDKNRTLLVQELKKMVIPGDVVLLKGSRANQLWKILEEI